MLYSRYAKKNKRLLKLQEAQRAEIKKATLAKENARNHEEKLKIESNSRTKLNKLVDEYHESSKSKKDSADSEQKKRDELEAKRLEEEKLKAEANKMIDL